MEDGHAGFLMDGFQERTGFIVQVLIQSTKRLIQTENPRAARQGSTQSHSLSFPATKALGQALHEVLKVEPSSHFIHSFADFFHRERSQTQ
jgi:hypothetical protein